MAIKNQSFFLLFLAVLLPACWPEKKPEKKKGLVVVNVLEEELYNDCRIRDSINVPFEKVDEIAQIVDKEADVVIYCSNYQCTSSEYAAKTLSEKGFDNVWVYEAGMAEWYQQGLPIDGPQQKAYLKKVCRQLPQDESSKIPVISTQELAQKMKVSLKKSDVAA